MINYLIFIIFNRLLKNKKTKKQFKIFFLVKTRLDIYNLSQLHYLLRKSHNKQMPIMVIISS